MKIRSPAFAHNEAIPRLYTCDDKDLSPALQWSEIPAEADSLVLIVDDPDAPDPAAPKMTWVHWLLYNLPISSHGLPEGVPPSSLPEGTLQGTIGQRTTFPRPMPGRATDKHVYFPGAPVAALVAPNTYNRPHTITAEVEVAPGQKNGVIVAQGGRFAGWSLYVKDGVGKYCHNYFDLEYSYVEASEKLPAGKIKTH